MCVVCDLKRLQQGSEPAAAPELGASAWIAGQQAQAAPGPRGAMPRGSGQPGRRILIKGATLLTMDPAIGDFARGDVLIDGKTIAAVAESIDGGDAAVINAKGMIVSPGFIDTHHHQFETALRGFLADAILINDGKPHGKFNYYEYMLLNFSKQYTPEDVYISELVASLSQLEGGVTTVMDVSQIHHSPEHTDAVIKALVDGGRRSVMGYFEGSGDRCQYPADAKRVKSQYFSASDGLLSMVMGGEIYIPGHEELWRLGRELDLPIALHVVGTFGMAAQFDQLAREGKFGSDNIFIHMTGMSDLAWQAAADAGAHISLSVPIEMQMRHGEPPIAKALSLGMQPSLSSDVQCTMTADSFTQMRSAMTLQRMAVNEAALRGEEDLPDLLTSRDVLRFATLEGAKGLRLDKKVGSITPGKEADLVLLDAEAINVAPLNHATGAVVTLMDRGNVEAVMVAGKFRKWDGRLLDVDWPKLRAELEASRDRLFERAGVPQNILMG